MSGHSAENGEPRYVTADDLRRYFPENGWHGASLGGLRAEVRVRGDDEYERHDLYQCRDCAALTTSPEAHVEWHERTRVIPPASTGTQP